MQTRVAERDGSVLVSEMAAGRITRVHRDGTTETVAEVGGGPNGLGRLPDGRSVVCQNGGSSFGTGWWPYDFDGAASVYRPVGPAENPLTPQLQLIEADGSVRTLATEFVARSGRILPLVRPSDICVDADGGFNQDVGASQDDVGSFGSVSGTCASAGDDEDGVTFTGPFAPGSLASFTVTAGSATACTLNAWVDWNRNGVFTDAGEQIEAGSLGVDGHRRGQYSLCPPDMQRIHDRPGSAPE